MMRTMNNYQQVNKRSQMTSEKKFCGVCHKAGKSEKEYTSHYTKSTPGPNGIVVCPTILSNHCNKCNGYGHFSDHCSVKAKVTDVVRARPNDHSESNSKEVERKPKVEKPQEKSYEELWPTIGQVAGTKRVRDGNMFAALENEAMPSVKPAAHKMNFKKMLETEYVAPKEEDRFIGNMLVIDRNGYTVFKENNVPEEITYENNGDWDEEYYDEEDEWQQEDYEDEIDRRLTERNDVLNYYEDEPENWEDEW